MSKKMCRITFLKGFAPIEVESGANLMATLNAQEIPVASSCKGDGVCGRCRIKILEGAKSLSEIGAQENLARNTHNIGGNERLSCQVKVLGDIKIDTAYW